VQTLILAKTIKGRGFSEIERQENWHRVGGLGSAVPESLVDDGIPPLWLQHNAVRIMPRLGTRPELLTSGAVDAASIDCTARHLLDGTPPQSDRQDASTLAAQRRSAAPT
jgi:hypothetical protein